MTQRVSIGARFEQRLGDLSGVLRRPLPLTFDAIGRHVMQERRAMDWRIAVGPARRSRMDESRIFMQQGAKCIEIAVDHGFDGALEARVSGVRAAHILQMLHEIRR